MVKLYRFEKLEKERIETIAKGELWISSPSKFNDLDDCRIRGLYSGVVDSKYFELVNKSLDELYSESNKFPFSNDFYNQIKSYIEHTVADYSTHKSRLKNDLHRSLSVNSIRKEIIKRTLISCFFEGDNKNSLMWAHYANNHSGFCVEYELTESEAMTFGFNKVNYASLMPEIYATELLFNPCETIARVVYTKSIEWSYEREWRYVEFQECNDINAVDGKIIKLPDNLRPTQIIIGARIDKRGLIEELKAAANQIKVGIIPYKSI